MPPRFPPQKWSAPSAQSCSPAQSAPNEKRWWARWRDTWSACCVAGFECATGSHNRLDHAVRSDPQVVLALVRLGAGGVGAVVVLGRDAEQVEPVPEPGVLELGPERGQRAAPGREQEDRRGGRVERGVVALGRVLVGCCRDRRGRVANVEDTAAEEGVEAAVSGCACGRRTERRVGVAGGGRGGEAYSSLLGQSMKGMP